MVIIKTTFGDITLTLDADKAPVTVANFLMIQGGGFDTEMRQKPTGAPIANEADNGLKNDFGTVAMARTSDPHSATAQFFINVKDNDFLNHSGKNAQGWGYAVFAKVTAGEEVLNKIRVLPTTSRHGHQDVPVDPVIIETVEIVED
jgi:peptidyl-prolyl cis-trans isomerase B (cyclophilin B)